MVSHISSSFDSPNTVFKAGHVLEQGFERYIHFLHARAFLDCIRPFCLSLKSPSAAMHIQKCIILTFLVQSLKFVNLASST